MSSGHSIARLYRDADGRSTGTAAASSSIRQLWLVGALVLVSLLWSGSPRTVAGAGPPTLLSAGQSTAAGTGLSPG